MISPSPVKKIMRVLLLKLLVISLAVSGSSVLAAEHAALKAFPQAQPGMQRFVIQLAEKSRDEEAAFKVEIIAGKDMLTDGTNLYRLGANIEAHSLQGWGYTYYEIAASSSNITTMMAPPEGAPAVMKFVTTAPLLVQYNSRLPLVIYAPNGFKVKYRIWSASPTSLDAEIK